MNEIINLPSPLSFSLKKSIGNNPAAWKDDMLWLQDLNKSNENAAANIPTKEIIAFQQMCKLSAKFLEYIKSESATATMWNATTKLFQQMCLAQIFSKCLHQQNMWNQ